MLLVFTFVSLQTSGHHESNLFPSERKWYKEQYHERCYISHFNALNLPASAVPHHITIWLLQYEGYVHMVMS